MEDLLAPCPPLPSLLETERGPRVSTRRVALPTMARP